MTHIGGKKICENLGEYSLPPEVHMIGEGYFEMIQGFPQPRDALALEALAA